LSVFLQNCTLTQWEIVLTAGCLKADAQNNWTLSWNINTSVQRRTDALNKPDIVIIYTLLLSIPVI